MAGEGAGPAGPAVTRLGRTRHLWVLRHAHAAGGSPTGDHGRPLADAGRREVAALGQPGGALARALAAGGARPELVATSSAARALATAEAAAAGLGLGPPRVEPSFYQADADDLVTWLATMTDDVSSVMVVGHNPAVHGLLSVLAAPPGAPSAEPAAAGGGAGGPVVPASFPPASLAVVVLDVERWRAVAPGTGRLLFVAVP